jgi:hypothetical protein
MPSALDNSPPRDGRDLIPEFLTWAPEHRTLQLAQQCGATDEVEEALRRAYARTEGAPKRLCPSSVVERELRAIGWQGKIVWAPGGLVVNESMDGWKEFPEEGLI